MNGDWMPSPSAISQTCHVFMAFWLVLLCQAYGLKGWRGFWIVFWFALVKEFFWDIVFEHDTWTSSATDFAFYLVGAFIKTEFLRRWPLPTRE